MPVHGEHNEVQGVNDVTDDGDNRDGADDLVEDILNPETRALWAKTPKPKEKRVAVGSWHPLACHVIDSGQTGSWLWDYFLSPGTRSKVNTALSGAVPGGGQSLISWLASLHDLGKATPSFQIGHKTRAVSVRAAGLPIATNAADGAPPHGILSGLLLLPSLLATGWSSAAAQWVGLTLAGHHGVFPPLNWTRQDPPEWQVGIGAWAEAREQLLGLACSRAGLAGPGDLAMPAPPLPVQMVIAGAVTVADWIASNPHVFPYVEDMPQDYERVSAERGAAVGRVLELGERWKPNPPKVPAELLRDRFQVIKEHGPKPVQVAACELAAAGGGGLLLIEAPMGVGKTEGALAAAEILAAATGADGVFDALPSRATANQMFGRVEGWIGPQPGIQAAVLAHGGARQHEGYQRLLSAGIAEHDSGVGASEWLAGRNRALLAPVVVGTIDQLLLSGVSSRFVALRHLGLSGKVVVIDEVHACDAYMSVILERVLAWLGAAQVPVVMLSATLAAGQRRSLLEAYANADVQNLTSGGYPRLSWVPAPERVEPRQSRAQKRGSAAAIERMTVSAKGENKTAHVHLVDERGTDAGTRLAQDLVTDGGCALVVRNTVGRAQETYLRLREADPDLEVMLFHAGFTAADRRWRELELVRMFGRGGDRPERHVTCATQVAEQSLDCDWDVLLSDLAPVDLLFQRLGRVHRHRVPLQERLSRLQLYVTGRAAVSGKPPYVAPDFGMYSDHLLLRTEAVLSELPELSLPGDIPRLVDLVYGDGPLGPPEWQGLMRSAANQDRAERQKMKRAAELVLLPPPGAASLASIHSRSNVGDAVDESTKEVQSVVRVGSPSIEVALLREAGSGTAVTVSAGERVEIPLTKTPDDHQTNRILDQVVRLPSRLFDDARAMAKNPPAWRGSPLLGRRMSFLSLPADESEPLRIGDYLCTYSTELGLKVTSA